ncbi:voltage-gated chloride channel family protein [Fibrella sp. HMF5335]|uniref:Voltage-gated chloride channel family protein n=1 Tax=Fibrella rubiginis TaxID=2817060 RepID=A0A939K206_9BACT|nr:voltage-gated chloride channel family protein [Fibrella rubiginis]MBO0935799.1 voltage-gated chloride channel family protein [Fibrella rubiginis]
MSALLTRFPVFAYISKWLFLSSIVAVGAGSASALFLVSLDWVTNYREAHPWLIALLPVGGFIIGWLYLRVGQSVVGGTNLVIDTIHQAGSRIPFRLFPLVLVGTLVTHLLGGSAGREGTALQLGGSLADQLTRPFRLSPTDRRLILMAGVSAGFGSVFGTPLAGAVFGLEVLVIGRLTYEAIFPVFIAALGADYVTRWWQVGHTYYAIATVPPITPVFALYALLAGIVFGGCALLFTRITHAITDLAKRHIAYAPLRPVVGGIIVAGAMWALGTTRYSGLGIPVIVESFTQQLPPYDFIVKLLLTAITLGMGFKGGEVTPLFFIGATLGNGLSYWLPLPTGLLAGMGFVAVFAGAANTPLACMVLALELFGTACGPYAAIACVTAYLCSGSRGIYGSQLPGEGKK